jgi:hypothetical protein
MYHIPVKLFCNPLIPVVYSEHGTIYLYERGHRMQAKPEDRMYSTKAT